MSRSGYSDYCEYMELYRASVDRAIAGKRGQALLRDLVTSLEAMPVKALARGVLREDGQVCALGAVGSKRGMKLEEIDPDDSEAVGKAFNIARCLAAEIAFENDDEFGYHRDENDEARWTRMHAWAKQLLKTSASQ